MDRVATLEKENDALRARVRRLEEALRLALFRQFGRSSEKLIGQADLPFEDLKEDETPQSLEVVAIETQETRAKAGRKPLAASLPHEEHFHDLTQTEKVCACGYEMVKIGEDVHEKLVMIPAQVWVDRHHYAKYACTHCEGLADETKPAVRTAARTPDLFPRSIVSAELLAHIWTAKFVDHLPFYRQEAGFARIGAEISRQDMVNWTMKVTGMLEPLIGLIEETIREGPVIQMDETPVKVLTLDHTGTHGLGRMWLALGRSGEHRAVRYRFAPGRGNQHAKTLLGDAFHGWLQTDGYSGYDTALAGTDIRHVGCWAHARRKFTDAQKVAPSPVTTDALGRIGKLYEWEKQVRDAARKEQLTETEFLERRTRLVGPYLEGLKTWMRQMAATTLPSGKTGEALSYTLGQWDKLERFLDHPWLTPDNNRAENAIRPFVIGRKNWLFHGNDAGAEASCRVFTLIETAKINGVEPYAYLRQILTMLPEVRDSGDWKSLLPWNVSSGKI